MSSGKKTHDENVEKKKIERKQQATRNETDDTKY